MEAVINVKQFIKDRLAQNPETGEMVNNRSVGRRLSLKFPDGNYIQLRDLGYNEGDGLFSVSKFPNRQNLITDYEMRSAPRRKASSGDHRSNNTRPAKKAFLVVGTNLHMEINGIMYLVYVDSVSPHISCTSATPLF